ncbi:hypothetical protein E2986_00703 [Frieseomelitta varia]|uniref:Shugoshin C-terminal domain-containing protein n=1 Tax=Frieseomelitta varia TaxID=561572 RepID=A0A833W051_9HYME|nr:hypothetical protein E2986_00703 [Frieseomelitta varia]
MPQILRRKKAKRSQKRVLVKRRHFLTSFHETKSYKPCEFCEKYMFAICVICKQLQNNNNLLAKALSKERHESQLLFSQNVALIAEVQDLGLACNKRDAIISNVLKNAKEMLKMLVTMSGYLTNTIASCQEFAESVTTNMQMTYNSNGHRYVEKKILSEKESLKRLSIKSPTRGVVKPMVSGYTITKPTINLSRLNMQHINNSSNLSIIPEIRTPPRNQELDNSISPNGVSVRRTCKNGRTYRMPERLTATSPRDSDESERRFSERNNRHSTGKMSGRMSGKLSKSKSRLSRNSNSSNSSNSSIENFEYIGSPRVKLNDVSKLLQNSHTINIRTLTENQNNQEVDGSKCNNVVNSEDSQAEIIPTTSPSNDSIDSNDKTTESKNEQSNNELNTTNEHCSSNWEDPLEGPSWLFNNSQVVPSFRSKDKKTDDMNVSNGDSMSLVLTEKESNNVFDNDKTMQEMSNTHANHANNFENSEQVNNEDESNVHQHNENNEICNEIVVADTNDNECKSAPLNFITQRRGCFENEDEDDFTLIYTKQPRNMHFDINDLRLPVLEQSALKPTTPAEPEPEITTTLRKISEICPIPSVSHNLVRNTLDESAFNQSTVKLPLLLNDDCEDVESTSVKKKSKMSQQKSKKKKETAAQSNDDFVANTPPFKKNNLYKRKKNKPVKDPSTVKVVLQKLNESDVKSRTPSPNETVSHNSNQNFDSESSTSTNSLFACNRPRRKRTPVAYHEPNLIKKLRRNQ